MVEDVVLAARCAAAIGCGLMAGLFFAFSVAVMRALGRLAPAAGMAAMQAINAAILNPVFLGVFFGTAAACLVVLVSSLSRGHESGALSFAAGSAFYLAGALLVTVVVNVPMNNALAARRSDDGGSAARWAAYLRNWTAWNHVRTVASLAAAITLTFALCGSA